MAISKCPTWVPSTILDVIGSGFSWFHGLVDSTAPAPRRISTQSGNGRLSYWRFCKISPYDFTGSPNANRSQRCMGRTGLRQDIEQSSALTNFDLRHLAPFRNEGGSKRARSKNEAIAPLQLPCTIWRAMGGMRRVASRVTGRRQRREPRSGKK